jgi:hypothetical protein
MHDVEMLSRNVRVCKCILCVVVTATWQSIGVSVHE